MKKEEMEKVIENINNMLQNIKQQIQEIDTEIAETKTEIGTDTEALENPNFNWRGDEKAEWYHELASKRLWLEELIKKHETLIVQESKFYDIIIKLDRIYTEIVDIQAEIDDDIKALENPDFTWRGDEKAEWHHELASKRLYLEELIKQLNIICSEIDTLTEGNTNGRGKN